MKSILIVFATFLILFSTVKTCSTELDVDYRGVPTSNDISFVRTTSFQDCCTKCGAEPKCQAWTFVFATGVCWLKTSIGYKIPLLGRISGVRPTTTIPTTTLAPTTKVCTLESENVYAYNDITLPLTIATPADCCTTCGKTAGCVAWSYLVDFKYCYLKNTLPTSQNRIPYKNSFSGVVIN